jgi:flagellar hook-length control protein FliK
MQPSLPVALPAQITATPLAGKLQPEPTGFGDELLKLLAAIAPTQTTAQPQMPKATPDAGETSVTRQSGGTIPAEEPVPEHQQTASSSPAAETLLSSVATTLPQLPEACAKALPAQTNATVLRPRISPATRREPTKSASTELPVSDPPVVHQQQPIATLATVAPNVEGPVLPASAHDVFGDTSKPISLAKPPPPQAVAAKPSDANPATCEAALTPADQSVSTPDQVADNTAVQSVTVTLASPPLPAPPITPAASVPVAATSGAINSPHPTPAAQIAPALVSLGHAPDGASRLTMRLEPPDLGQVQIRIDRPTVDTAARVAITVEKPETLTLLLRDQPELQRALDQAGVPVEGRSVTFHIATPAPAARTDTAAAPLPTGSTSSMGGDMSHGASRDSGRRTQPDAVSANDSDQVEAIQAAEPTWLRAGLDITA